MKKPTVPLPITGNMLDTYNLIRGCEYGLKLGDLKELQKNISYESIANNIATLFRRKLIECREGRRYFAV